MSFTQLTKEERCLIECLIAKNPAISIREIARQLGKSPSTISREIRRNGSKDSYCGLSAHAAYMNRRE